MYRLGQLFDFFRMLSFFFTTVGYYVCTMVSNFSLLFYYSLFPEFCFIHHTFQASSYNWREKYVSFSCLLTLAFCHNIFSLLQMTVLTVYIFLYGRAYLVKCLKLVSFSGFLIVLVVCLCV